MLNLLIQTFFQLMLFGAAFAAPLSAQGHNSSMRYGVGGGVVGFIVLVLDIIVWIEVLQSNRPIPNKILWAVLVFIFPVAGAIIYFLFSNRAQHRSGGYEPIST